MEFRKANIRLKKKFKAIWSIIKARGVPKTIHIAPDNEARAIIYQVLSTKLNLKIENTQHTLVIKNAADEILARMKSPPEKSTDQMMTNLLDGVSSQAFWFHAMKQPHLSEYETGTRIPRAKAMNRIRERLSKELPKSGM